MRLDRILTVEPEEYMKEKELEEKTSRLSVEHFKESLPIGL